MKKYKYYATKYEGDLMDATDGQEFYLASDADARIADLENALRKIKYLSEGYIAALYKEINATATNVLMDTGVGK